MREPFTTGEKWTNFILAIIVIGIIIGSRYLWAKYVYHDARCVWAECRILK